IQTIAARTRNAAVRRGARGMLIVITGESSAPRLQPDCPERRLALSEEEGVCRKRQAVRLTLDFRSGPLQKHSIARPRPRLKAAINGGPLLRHYGERIALQRSTRVLSPDRLLEPLGG